MSKTLVQNNLFTYTLQHFESLKHIPKKCIQYTYNNFEYDEYENLEFNSFSMTFENRDWGSFFSFYYQNNGVFKIGLRICGYDMNDEYYSDKCVYFKFLQNQYVHKNLNQMVAVWINLVLKYKRVQYCDNILNEYIWYKEKIEHYLQMIEVGSRFRNQCLWHRLPFEVRKKIYDAVVKAYCDGNLMECKAFAHKIFP